MKDEKTASLLRPHQIAAFKDEANRLRGVIQSPHAQDPGTARTTLRRLEAQVEAQSAKPFASNEIDTAAKRARELEAEISEGMPTQAEMRRKPPGAVGKHMAWEKKNKKKILEWKNLQCRLNVGNEDPDIANFEKFRPAGGSGELNLSEAFIPGKTIDIPSIGPKTVFTDLEIALVKSVMPEMADRLSTLSDVERENLKTALVRSLETPAQVPAKKNKGGWPKGKPRGKPQAEAVAQAA